MDPLGFGCLRLPMAGAQPDWQAVNTMVDSFLQGGGSYFDTCYTYLDGQSEAAIRRCLTSRYPRHRYRLCNKLPGYLLHSYEECQAYFDEMLRRCGVTWLDVLMLHWLNGENYAIAENCDQFRFLREKKAQGLARAIGFSFHGDAGLLDRILTAHPEVDVVLLQLNYLDWESPGIQSRRCYETCLAHGKVVVAMEPVKGGTLASLPPTVEALLRQARPDLTPADWALSFVRQLPGVAVCLSGMGTVEQVRANVREFPPLTAEELALLPRVREMLEADAAIGCTGCGYCLPHCPRGLPIPDLFRLYNHLRREPEEDWKLTPAYEALAQTGRAAGDCLGCGSCQDHCPQHLPIPRHMEAVAAGFSPEK